MSKRVKIVLLSAVIAVCAAVTAFYALRGTESSPRRPGKPAVKVDRGMKNRGEFHRRTGKSVEESKFNPTRKPKFALEADEESKLTDIQRRMLEEIREACDSDDRRLVIKLVQKMQASDEWPDGIPSILKQEAISALGWFGIDALAELAGFLKDNDPDVQAAAIEAFEDALSDPDLGDRERAAILKAAAKVITDADALEFMMIELDRMRNSVAADAAIDILNNGTDEAKAAIREAMEDRFEYDDDSGVEKPPPKNAKELEEWSRKHPDDPDDEDFYGSSKDED